MWIVCCPDSKVRGANMGPIWGRQDPGGPHVGAINFAIWELKVLTPHVSHAMGFCVTISWSQLDCLLNVHKLSAMRHECGVKSVTFPFPNLNGAPVDVWEWISCFIPSFYFPLLGFKLFYVIKRVQETSHRTVPWYHLSVMTSHNVSRRRCVYIVALSNKKNHIISFNDLVFKKIHGLNGLMTLLVH